MKEYSIQVKRAHLVRANIAGGAASAGDDEAESALVASGRHVEPLSGAERNCHSGHGYTHTVLTRSSRGTNRIIA